MDSARAATAKTEGGPAANEAPPAAASNGTTPNSANGANGANGNSANPNWWSPQEDKLFEKVLSEKYGEKMEDVLEECARQIPTKDVEAVRRRFEQLEQDVNNIEAGRVPLPNYADSGSMAVGGSRKGGKGSGGKKEQHSERKKGIPWTEEEHRLFLLGLEKYGKGDWRSISRNFVVSRTPTQVASHAQKYFIRLSSINKRDKRRASIHDITSVDQADLASVHAARQASQEALAQAQAQAAGQQGKPMFGGGMVSMPPASYVSNMNMPQSGPQQYV